MIRRGVVAVALALLTGTAAAAPADTDSVALERVRGLVAERRLDEAEAAARSRLAEGAAIASPERAGLLDAVVYVMMQTGRTAEPECGAIARRALEMKQDLYGPDAAELASSHLNLGEHLRTIDTFDEAREHLRRALAIRESALGPSDPATVRVLGHLADLETQAGHYDAAEAMFARQLAALEDAYGPDGEPLVSCLYGYAGLHARTAEYDAAVAEYERALAIARRAHGADHVFNAYLLNGLAIVHDERRDYEKARAAYEEAIRIAEAGMGADDPFVGSCLNNLGFLLKKLGDYEEARRLYERALAIHETAYGPEHSYTASTLWNLAEIYQRLGDLDTALAMNERALAIREKVLGPDHPETATSLWRIGEIHLLRGDPETALGILQRALAIRRAVLGPEHHHTAEALDAVGRAQLALGNAEAARRCHEEALATIERALGPENPRNADVLIGLARALSALGDDRAACVAALRAEAVSREHARLTASTLPERQALQHAKVRTGGLDHVLSLVADGRDPEVAEAWDGLVRSRALVLDVFAMRRAALRAADDPETDALERDYADASRRYANLLVRGPSDDGAEDFRAGVEAARVEREELERRLALRSERSRAALARARIGWREVADALPAAAALVAYARYAHSPGDTRYVAFVQRPGRRPAAVPLGPADVIDRGVAAWAAEVVAASPEHTVDAYRRAAGALRRLIWDPVAPHLEGADRVFVVPDAALHRVAFATLPAEPSGYLIERGPRFQYVSTERDLVRDTGRPARGPGMLVVGGVDFDASPSGAAGGAGTAAAAERSPAPDSFQAVRFERLPASEVEARTVATLWNDAHDAAGDARAILLTGAAAVERAVKEALVGRRVVHLATHGFVLGSAAPAAGPGARGIGGLGEYTAPSPPRASGLRLSGIVLAGANRRAGVFGGGDDGILTAEEIAALDLSDADWVVLSACDTGLGDVQTGEGVLGLRRAFEIAGAHTLVMSLWPVEDEPARRWMEALYRARLSDGLGTSDCVHRASLEMLQRARRVLGTDHPSSWGAFVGVGEGS